MTDTKPTVAAGRDLYDATHNTEPVTPPKPKRGEKSVNAGRALYDNKGAFAAYDA